MNWSIVYKDDTGGEFLLGECCTSHSISVDDALRIAGIDMDKYAQENGWDDWDWDCLEIRLEK